MVPIFPLAKIGLLLMKQLSKPLANFIKNEAKKHHNIRKYVILPTGKAYHWVEMQTMIRVKGEKPEETLSEEEIVELGANAIGEIVLFGFLSGIILYEYHRQGDKKAVIQKTKDDEISNLVTIVVELIEDIENLKKTVNKVQNDMRVSFDVIELEEQRHPAVYDYNFIDVITGNSRAANLKKKRKPLDLNSPSI